MKTYSFDCLRLQCVTNCVVSAFYRQACKYLPFTALLLLLMMMMVVVVVLLLRLGGLPRWFPVGTVKSFGEPHSVGISNYLVGAK